MVLPAELTPKCVVLGYTASHARGLGAVTLPTIDAERVGAGGCIPRARARLVHSVPVSQVNIMSIISSEEWRRYTISCPTVIHVKLLTPYMV